MVVSNRRKPYALTDDLRLASGEPELLLHFWDSCGNRRNNNRADF
jgi:hypothetical protein